MTLFEFVMFPMTHGVFSYAEIAALSATIEALQFEALNRQLTKAPSPVKAGRRRKV